MELFSCLTCCGKRNKNPDLITLQNQANFNMIDSKTVYGLFYEYENKLLELRNIPI
jgi:hypothetical protein